VAFGYRNTKKVLPGVRLTASKRGLSVSGGPKGAKLSVSTRGEKRASASWFGFFWRRRVK
jgi:hypothetical protein